MKEAALRTKIKNALKAYGGYWTVTVANMHGQGGLPDITGCFHGRFYGLEVKRPGKEHTLTERQAYVLKRIKKAGGISGVVTTVDEAMAIVYANE